MPIAISLTKEQAAEAIAEGKRKSASAASKGWRPRFAADSIDWKINSVIGELGERAFALWAGLPWICGDRPGQYDFPREKVEVRTRRLPGKGKDLMLFKEQDGPKADSPFVLLHLHTRHDLEVVGWMLGTEIMIPQFHKDYERYKPHGCYCVPPHLLRDPASLLAMIRPSTDYLNDHLCHCGKYGTHATGFGRIAELEWRCGDHKHA